MKTASTELLAFELLEERSVTLIDYRMDQVLDSPNCTEANKAFIAKVREQSNDLDRIHLCCTQELGLTEQSKALTDWIEAKDKKKVVKNV